MPHSIFRFDAGGQQQIVSTTGLAASRIRDLIDTGGVFRGHADSPATPIQAPIPQASSQLMIPGGVGSSIPWGDIIRDQITRLFDFGNGNGGGNGGPPAVVPEQTPVGGGLMVPDFGSFPAVGCGSRAKVGYISLPDGTVGCPSGYHPEKSGKGYCVRNRRMNPLNPRALARAGRRVGGFARAVKRARSLKKVCRSL